jgi:hypothetical protein
MTNGVKPSERCGKAEVVAYGETARAAAAADGLILCCAECDAPAAPRSCYCEDCERDLLDG